MKNAPPVGITRRTYIISVSDNGALYVETCPVDYVGTYHILNTPMRKLQGMLE